MEENKTVRERRKRRRFDRFCFPPSDDEENKIVRKRKRRGFDWYYLPSGDDHKEIIGIGSAEAEEDEEEEGKKKKKKEESCRRRWSELPDGILDQVLARLAWPLDLVCFGRVCRPWRSVREGFTPAPRSSCPWLVYRGDGTIRGRGGFNVDASSEKFVFYSLAGRDGCWGVRGGQVVVELPGTRGVYIRGCSHGWLFFAYSEVAAPSFLVNPATNARIMLPLWTGRGGGRRRSAASPAVVSSSPVDGPRCVVAFIADDLLVFCRIGDRNWSAVSTGAPYRILDFYERDSGSIVAHDGKIYFLTQGQGMLGVFDPNADDPKMSLTWLIDRPQYRGSSNYLVESCGQVLLVILSWIETMRVLKLDMRNRVWVDITEEGLSNRMTFIAHGSSLSVCASSLEGSECVPGYVYLSSPFVRSEYFEKTEMGGKQIYRAPSSKILGLPFTKASHWFVPSF